MFPPAQGGLTVREYHGIGTTNRDIEGAGQIPDPDVAAIAPYFEWPQSGDIEVNPAENVRDNYGWHLSGYIHPPETGEYIFFVATDDNSELWLSTDVILQMLLRLHRNQPGMEFASTCLRVRRKLLLQSSLKRVKLTLSSALLRKAAAVTIWLLLGVFRLTRVQTLRLVVFRSPVNTFTIYLDWARNTGVRCDSTCWCDNSTDFTVKATINNGQNGKVAEFTKLEVGGKDVLGDAEVTLGGISSSISVDASADAYSS